MTILMRFALSAAIAAAMAFAQEEGGGGGGMGGGGGRMGGGGMGGMGGGMMMSRPSKFDMMTGPLNLDKDQKKQFKTVIDTAAKEAGPVREQLAKDRATLAATIQAGKSGPELQALINSHAALRAKMTQLELRAFTDIYSQLTADQRKGAKQFYISFLNIFMKKNWNE